MKTRKITVFAIASILGAIALTGCGRAVETSMNAAKAQPSTEAAQTAEAAAPAATQPAAEQSANAAAWYYIAGENFAMTEGEWISNKDEFTKDEWEHYYDSAEHRFVFASQQAGLNAIAASGIADGMIVSCDFVNYDYDKLQYAFKVGVRPMSAPNAPVQYFMAGTDYAEKC
jgi:hypothetical protein